MNCLFSICSQNLTLFLNKINMEEWRDIPNYEGKYQVSNLGRVKSLTRIVNFGSQKRTTKGQILKHQKNKKGYKIVFLSRKCFYVHQLVAIVFLNHTPDGFNTTVDHIDFDKSNNCVSNLRLISHKENSARTRRYIKHLAPL